MLRLVQPRRTRSGRHQRLSSLHNQVSARAEETRGAHQGCLQDGQCLPRHPIGENMKLCGGNHNLGENQKLFQRQCSAFSRDPLYSKPLPELKPPLRSKEREKGGSWEEGFQQ